MPNRGEIVLYLAEIPDPAAVECMDFSCLSQQERQRADRFVREEKRRSFLFSHWFLRQMLGQMLGVSPSAVDFDRGEHGKPFLCGRHLNAGVHFNLSHSGERLLAGIADTPLGVDIERMRDKLDYLRFSRRFFSPLEQEQLRAVPAADRQRAFFDGWTRKEAFLKAMGCGLTLGLDQFDVSLAPVARDALLATHYSAEVRHRWLLRSLTVGGNYRAAVAWQGADRQIRLNTFRAGIKKGAEAPFF